MNRTRQTILASGLLALLVGGLYGDALSHLARQWWQNPDYSHGPLVVLLSAYLVWERRERLRQLADRPSGLGLVFLAGGVLLFLLGHLAAELFTMRVSLLVVLGGLVLYLMGQRHLRTLAFPLLYLMFMIPPPTLVSNAVTFPLQLFAARTATTALELLGIPVLREGNVIALASTTLEVVEACSGIRSLITLLALAAAYGYFTQPHRWRRGLLFLAAVPIAIVANAGRVAGTGALAHVFGAEVAQGFFHGFSGWVVFVAALILLFAFDVCLRALPDGTRVPAPAPSAGQGV